MFSEIPLNWLPANASRAPLKLVNAVAFSRSATPPPDQWTHFAKLRPIPGWLFKASVAIVLVCIWGIVGTITQYPDEWLNAIGFLVIMAAGIVFFGWAIVKALLAYPIRTGWPGLHGLGLGESGIAIRVADNNSDIPWDDVTAIRATVTNEFERKKAKISVLRIEYSGVAVEFGTEIMGASPIVLYRAMLYYWINKTSRDELGTTVAQKRMDGWLAEIQ